LNGNWYENRQAIPQVHQLKPDLKIKREKEPDLNCLSSSGLPAPLGAIKRKPKQETTGLIPDDGFRELKTINQTHTVDPKKHAVPYKPVLSMINKYNIAELSLVDRPIKGTNTGFGAVINRHPDNHAARYFNTENRDAYGEPQRLDAN